MASDLNPGVKAFNDLMDTLFDEKEKIKIIWTIGAIGTGYSRVTSRPLFLICGDPATGKTTTIDIVSELFESRTEDVVYIWSPDLSLERVDGSHMSLTAGESAVIRGITFMSVNVPIGKVCTTGLMIAFTSGRTVCKDHYKELREIIANSSAEIIEYCKTVFDGMGSHFYDDFSYSDEDYKDKDEEDDSESELVMIKKDLAKLDERITNIESKLNELEERLGDEMSYLIRRMGPSRAKKR